MRDVWHDGLDAYVGFSLALPHSAQCVTAAPVSATSKENIIRWGQMRGFLRFCFFFFGRGVACGVTANLINEE